VSVTVVGSVALDSVRTPFGEATEALGGSAAYFAVAARHFVPVSIVAVVGEDFPEEHVQLLRDRGVDLSGLETARGRTFRWAGEYGYDLNTRETLRTELNVFADFKPKLGEAHRAARFLFLANIHPELQHDVLEQVPKPEMVLLDTMNYWIERAPKELDKVLRRADVVLVNDEEARQLTKESNLLKAARKILASGPSIAVIKKGEHGCLVHGRDFLFAAPVFPLEDIVDPTGAGDTFAGGFLGYLAASEDPWDEKEIRRAAVYGTVLASFTVESFSLRRLSLATREEIDHRFREIRRIAEVEAAL